MSVPPGVAQIMVRHVIDGARRRLLDAGCQQLLGDFADGEGNSLWDNLHAGGLTPVQHLSQIWFVDATGEPLCENAAVAAYTTPRGRVVFVCGARFTAAAGSLCGPAGEMIVIHEFLHTLGLGENPPTSDQITRQVWRRCGQA